MAFTLGVLLAGGRGARLGMQTPKALVTLAGTTVIERAARTLEAVCDDVVVSGPEDLREALSAALGRRLRYAADPPAAAGPLAGVVAGLAAADFAAALVLGVDFPLAVPQALRRLVAWFLEERVAHVPGSRPAPSALVPAPGGTPQPLVAAYGPEAREALAACLVAGERSIVSAVRTLAPRWIEDALISELEGGAENFFNVNHPADLAEAERRLRERRAS
ncbi:MAG TPA: NTP transferase domain-containing protein [Candidatus Limnocylindria bacterium]|nr:NTP transferase domain-containing protein [Candidatus Limnocylindria bacterium]